MPRSSGGGISNNNDIGHLFGNYGVPLAVTATTVLGYLSYQAYRWYLTRLELTDRSRRLLQRAKSSLGELPMARPVLMGGEEKFRAYIKSSRLPEELKKTLCKDGVFIENPEKVVVLLEKMILDGSECFQVVTDFDATLTRYHRDGKRCSSSYGILDSNNMLPPWYREEAEKLRQKYYPIELDPTLTIEEKTPHMRDWWTSAHDLLKKTNLSSSWLGKMVEQSTVELRDRTGVFFAILDHCTIPLLIYSAGIGDLIKEVLIQRCNFRNFAQEPMIVANFLKFDDKGLLEGFSDELIHTFNKHEIFPHHLDYFLKHEKRRNALLMGDMLGDLRMADGLRARENLVTIGFLNSKIEEWFPQYRDSFDIVLIDDQTLDVPIAIVEAIIKSPLP